MVRFRVSFVAKKHGGVMSEGEMGGADRVLSAEERAGVKSRAATTVRGGVEQRAGEISRAAVDELAGLGVVSTMVVAFPEAVQADMAEGKMRLGVVTSSPTATIAKWMFEEAANKLHEEDDFEESEEADATELARRAAYVPPGDYSQEAIAGAKALIDRIETLDSWEEAVSLVLSKTRPRV